MLAEQITNDPPPLAESLHWLIVTPWAAAWVPTAVQIRPTSVPPLADPLHCVMVAPEVVAGNGTQPMVMPPPEPTHWLTVAAVGVALTPMKVLMTSTLQRNVPPPVGRVVALRHGGDRLGQDARLGRARRLGVAGGAVTLAHGHGGRSTAGGDRVVDGDLADQAEARGVIDTVAAGGRRGDGRRGVRSSDAWRHL